MQAVNIQSYSLYNIQYYICFHIKFKCVCLKVILGTLVSYLGMFEGRYSMSVVGEIPTG